MFICIFETGKNWQRQTMITKEQFVNLINSLEKQFLFDKEYAESLGNTLQIEINPYNNSVLISAIFNLLRSYFPIKDNFCEIEHYCYFQNFGRIENDDEVVVETAEELYVRLLS